MNMLNAREISEEPSYSGSFRKTVSRQAKKKIVYPLS